MAKPPRADIWSTNLPIVVGLVGVTDGLEICAVPDVDAKTWHAGVEIDQGEVILSPSQPIYLLHRRVEQGKTVTWIGAYRKSLEIGRKRPGAYVGAGLWLRGSVRDSVGEAVLAVLARLLEQLQRLTMTDGAFTRSIASVREKVDLDSSKQDVSIIAKALDPAAMSIRIDEAVGYLDGSERGGVTLAWLLDWALDEGTLFGEFSRVVIGVRPEAFAGGQRSSQPVTPAALRRRAAFRQVAFNARPASQNAELKSASTASYEQLAQTERPSSGSKRPQQALPDNTNVDTGLGNERIIDYPRQGEVDSSIAASEKKRGGVARELSPHVVLNLLYVCAGLLAVIFITLLVICSSLQGSSRQG